LFWTKGLGFELNPLPSELDRRVFIGWLTIWVVPLVSRGVTDPSDFFNWCWLVEWLQPCTVKKSGGSLPWNYDEMILLIHGCGWHSAWWCFLISVLGKGIVY
jgi:hypothetical protein